ncbi:MAG: hypothetical protein K2K37_03330 [Muribaculaceae bacterium]|nr:hypothetical protein [Muribaculaceae bacterium]
MNFKSFAFKVSAAMMMAVGLYACSSSDDNGLYEYLSADKMVYLSVNLNEVYDNAGFEVTPDGVTPTEAFKKIISGNDADKALALLDMRGINLEKVVMMLDVQDNNGDGTIVFGINDKQKFDSYLQNNELTATNEDGFDVYKLDGKTCLVVDGDFGLIVDLDGSASATVKGLKDAAAKNPLKSWQMDALSKKHTVAAVMNIKEIYELSAKEKGLDMGPLSKIGYPVDKDAYGVFTSSLSGLKWEGEYNLCGADGKSLEIDIESYPLATSLLDYVNSKDCIVMLGAMPKNLDYSEILEKVGGKDAARQVAPVLKSIHSVMLAGGPLDITSYNRGEGWTGVLALELAPGSAQEYLNMAKLGASQFGLPVQKSDNEISVSDLFGINAKLKADGDNLVLSVNTPADTDRSSFKASDFGKLGGMMLDIPANTPSITFMSIPFGIQFKAALVEMGTTKGYLELTDTKGKLLQNVIEYVASKQ